MQLGDLTPVQFARVSSLTDEALDLRREARGQWLAALSDRNGEDAAIVRGLLVAHDTAATEGFLETREAIDRALAQAPRAESSMIGRRFGPYRALRMLGRGGMGTVWLAERADGLFTRRVALKLVHPSVAGAAAGERFAREREILASLDHPHIARLLDAGVTDDGQAYLALEYVEGAPINAYCDDNHLPLRARLRLFLQVASAVQFAHANLVIHRDLKPPNILVTRDGQVRLLDFGIAKLLHGRDADALELTQLDGGAFTPDYAAPEQIANGTITTASDVYALGVLLYELVCGCRPYQPRRATRGALEDAILGRDPAKPSQAALTDEMAGRRATTPRKLRQMLAGDLDTIVLKALRKEPLERYGTADAMARDVRHHLRAESVEARPDGRLYHLRKFVLRHRWAVAGATLTAFALVAGTAVSLWQASVASEHAIAAERAATKAKVVQDFLLDIFRTNSVEQANPVKAQQTSARSLLDIGAKRVADGLKDAPEAEEEVLNTLANMYYQLGLTDQAARPQDKRVALLKRMHGPDDPRVADALLSYAEAILDSTRREQILPVLDETRRILDRAGDPASGRRGELLMLYAHAHAYTSPAQMRRHADDALAHFLAHQPDSWKVPLAMQVGARARARLGDHHGAQTLYRSALAQVRKREPGPSVYLVVPLVGLAAARAALGDLEDAERHYREAVAVSLAQYGEQHPETLQSQAKLGAFLHGTSRRDEGRRLLASAARKVSPGGVDVPDFVVASVSSLFGASLLAEGRLEEAARFIAVDVADARQHYPQSAPLAGALAAQGALLVAQGEYDAAQRLFDEVSAIRKRIGQSSADPSIGNRSLIDQARLHVAQRRAADALEALSRMALPEPASRSPLVVEDVERRIVASQAYLQLQQSGAATASAREALDQVEQSSLRVYYQPLEAAATLALGQAELRAGPPEAARAMLERALALRVANDDAASPWLAEAQLALSACLARIGERNAAALLQAKARATLATHAKLGVHFARQLSDTPVLAKR